MIQNISARTCDTIQTSSLKTIAENSAAAEGAQHAQERLGCGMADRILTAEAAQTIQDEADRDRDLLTWVVMEAEDSAEVLARPVASGRGALPCALVAATLGELHGLLPVGLTRSPRQPGDPPGMVEVWYM
jgi:hypothetical protein